MASTNPMDLVPSANDSPGLMAKGPNKKIDPFCDACKIDTRMLLIHSKAMRVQGNQKVIPPIAQAKKMLPIIVFLFIFSLLPVNHAMEEIMKKPTKAILLYAISSMKKNSLVNMMK